MVKYSNDYHMYNLAFKGVSAIDFGIAPRHKFEINNTNEAITEDRS